MVKRDGGRNSTSKLLYSYRNERFAEFNTTFDEIQLLYMTNFLDILRNTKKLIVGGKILAALMHYLQVCVICAENCNKII